MAQIAWSTLTSRARSDTERLFALYDADGSGSIDHAEFMSICRSYDPSVDPMLVLQSYRSVAGPEVALPCTPLLSACHCCCFGDGALSPVYPPGPPRAPCRPINIG